ncbi:BatD family protein [Candidatus Parabeggiatoa sp. HSG14]|uniref:BatD family protein n=1 Tax=Candidatus Parabeggiatoa sp. HSG14 TaxID=3055593 RepID=UPI0025A8DA7F|nr:BatD family protein [Thiotrichales bacterium HSG14]
MQKLFFVCLTYLLFGIFPAVAAPQFVTTVDTNRVMLGETVTLKLELSGAKASDSPDVSQLEKVFAVYGPQHQQMTQIINGRMSSKIVWQYTLEPQKTGTFTIPSLTVNTDAGYLRSQPIRLKVTKTPVKRNDSIRLEATVSNPTPYLHQPLLYTLRLYHKGNLRELEPVLPSDGVIMEQLGKMTQQRTVNNGKQMIVAKVTYILTPLRSGKLELGSAKMKAMKPDSRGNNFGNSFFSFGPDYRPTTISSKPFTLKVQPPQISQHPWLPLTYLRLKQNWESDIQKSVIVGVPLIRTLTLVAQSMGGQAPPNLTAFVQSNADFRVRAPKPETERGILQDRKTPVTTITQSFSLIPLNTGQLQLPAIRIPWWNVKKNALAWAELPTQTIKVIPNQNYMTPQSQMTPANIATTASPPQKITVVNQPASQQIYFSQAQQALLALAISALLIALWHSWYTRYRLGSKMEYQRQVGDKKSWMSDAVFKKRLESSNELAAIKQLIQEYAHLRWQISKNASLQTIAQHLTKHYVGSGQTADLFNEFNAALYGKQTFDVMDWKKRCGILLTRLKEKKGFREKEETVFGPLNPI